MGRRQTSYDFALARPLDLTIAKKGRQDLVVPKVLAPRLELLGVPTDRLAEADEGVSKAVRIEIWKASADKGVAKYFPDPRGTSPVSPFQPDNLKLASRPQCDMCRRKERIVVAPKLILPEIVDPFRDDLANLVADWKEERGESLAEFGLDLARILFDAPRGKIDML